MSDTTFGTTPIGAVASQIVAKPPNVFEQSTVVTAPEVPSTQSTLVVLSSRLKANLDFVVGMNKAIESHADSVLGGVTATPATPAKDLKPKAASLFNGGTLAEIEATLYAFEDRLDELRDTLMRFTVL